TIEGTAVESADTCIRVRNTNGGTVLNMAGGNYWEPGTNPTTSKQGSKYDIDVPSKSDGTESIREVGNTQSGNHASVTIDPEGFHEIHGFTQPFYGARINGAAVAKKNLVRNGRFNYWGYPNNLPNWASFINGIVATEETGSYVTGQRSMRVTATSVSSSCKA